MSAHWRRVMHPKPKFAIFMGKLLGKQVNMFLSDAPFQYHLPRTNNVIKINPHYITQNW